MRTFGNLLLLLCFAATCGARTAAAAPIPITFGDTRSLQNIVDHHYGKGHIDVTRDYIGARAGDIDPWFWVGYNNIGGVSIKVLKRDRDLSLLGWYLENGQRPYGGGTLFSGPPNPHEQTFVILPGAGTRFGFYVDAPIPVLVPGGLPTKRFYTDRLLNDRGPDGKGAIHAPYDGDVEALVFDVSPWAGPDTWLVCFEDLDTGGIVTDGDPDDNPKIGGPHGNRKLDDDDDDPDLRRVQGCDFDDAVFEVHADGATLARIVTFGGLKLLYR